ncbi:MAG: SOS response-associated peptidase [Proteobacteria bacterium]|nr:SOS response-associated peptidase [Pseudomonadota bacterium]
MCGRYSITTPIESMRRFFRFEGPPLNLAPRWNVAPTQTAPVVRQREGRRHLEMLRWGLVPPWAKDLSIGSRMINARGETAAEKPAFRAAFKSRRCLVIADGFYEWPIVGAGTAKQPVLFRMQDGAPFAFAGLWEHWHSPAGEAVETYCIVSTAANEIMAQFHHRVPLVLAPDDYAAWLDPAVDAQPLLKAPPSSWFTFTYVSTYVNNVRNDDARCFEPAELAPPPEKPKKKRAATSATRQSSLF